MHNKKYFCYEIYKNLDITSYNGSLNYSPCCVYSGSIKTENKFDIDSVWNGAERQSLKDCVENDIPILGCSNCYKQEEVGIVSRRQSAKILYEDYHHDTNIDLDAPQGLDYSVGNLCNLKCIICGPHDSSQWVPDYQKLNPGVDTQIFKYKKFEQLEIPSTQALKNIKNIHFHGGGDPLLSDNHINLLKKIDEIKGLGDVRVFYNINGTKTVSNDLLLLWEKCKLIELYFSIDDIGPRFEYQRTGARWGEVEKNLQWFVKNMPHNHMFKINCCWGYLNLYYLDELYYWWENNFKTNRYGDHTNLIFQQVRNTYAITHLSQSVIDILRQKFSNNNELLSLVDTIQVSDASHEKFWGEITKLDSIRNLDFKSVNPEWSQLLL